MYKRLLPITALAALISLLSCATPSRVADAGSLDRRLVELLPDGTAKTVDILAFNDFHATVSEDPLGKNPGMAKMATVLENIRAVNPNTLLVSGGGQLPGLGPLHRHQGKDRQRVLQGHKAHGERGWATMSSTGATASSPTGPSREASPSSRPISSTGARAPYPRGPGPIS